MPVGRLGLVLSFILRSSSDVCLDADARGRAAQYQGAEVGHGRKEPRPCGREQAWVGAEVKDEQGDVAQTCL